MKAPSCRRRCLDLAASTSRTGPLRAILLTAPWWWWKARPSLFLPRSRHHACHRSRSQRVRHRPILLADLYARGLRSAVLHRPHRRDGGFRSGASILGALFTGTGTGALALVIGQITFAVIRSLTFRVIVAAAFAIPAAIAGYHAVLGLSQIGMPSLIWREVFAWIGAILIGSTAWARMTVLAEPLPLTRASDRCRFGYRSYRSAGCQ
jgi:hypothetical protein